MKRGVEMKSRPKQPSELVAVPQSYQRPDAWLVIGAGCYERGPLPTLDEQ